MYREVVNLLLTNPHGRKALQHLADYFFVQGVGNEQAGGGSEAGRVSGRAQAGLAVDYQKTTFGNAFEHWLECIHKPSIRSSSYQTYLNMYKNHIAACGISGLRHTFCTILARRGVSLLDASRLMGHSNISMAAEIYSHVTDDDKRQAVDKLKIYFA